MKPPRIPVSAFLGRADTTPTIQRFTCPCRRPGAHGTGTGCSGAAGTGGTVCAWCAEHCRPKMIGGRR